MDGIPRRKLEIIPFCPDTTWDIAGIAHKVHSGKEEHCNLLIPWDQIPGVLDAHMLQQKQQIPHGYRYKSCGEDLSLCLIMWETTLHKYES